MYVVEKLYKGNTLRLENAPPDVVAYADAMWGTISVASYDKMNIARFI